ncbi:MAG: YciE/YciF ferroxidase family protein [Solirubrobacteraceae bacterium]
MAELGARDAKLVQYLNEAYGKEKELETALQAHIAMTTRAPYRKRLQQHLKETKQHVRLLERRVKQLGGSPHSVPLGAPEPLLKSAQVAVEVGSRALAAAQGPLHALRGTGEQEKMLKNAKTEYREEHEEIATYTAIESLAQLVGDGETAKLARTIRREEENMARFLVRQIPALAKAVAQEEIPAAQRRGGSSRRTTSRSTAAKSGARKAAGAKRASGKASTVKAASRASARKARPGKAPSRAGASRAGASRAGAGRAGGRKASARKAPARKA